MVTEKKFEFLENSQASLTLTIDASSIEKAYDEKLKKYTKDVEMPGFRKGHVPSSVLERKFGDQIREEVTFDLMEENLKETIESLDKKEKPLTYCVPVLQDEEKLLPFKKNSDVTYTVKYDVNPVFDLPQYTGLEVEFEDKKVTDEDVNAEIEKLREQNAIVVNKSTPAEMGDIATVSYTVSENGETLENYSRTDFSLTLGKTYNIFKIDEDVVGMSQGEEKTIERTYSEEDAPDEELKNKTLTLSLTLTKLKMRELPEVDDDFAMDVKEEYKTVDDLKNGVRKDLEEKLASYVENAKQAAVVDKIVNSVDFAIPASMIDAINENKWQTFVSQTYGDEKFVLSYLKKIGQSKEDVVSSWSEESKVDAKRQVVLTAIAEKENFEVTEDEIAKAAGEGYDKLSDGDKAKYRDFIAEEVRYEKTLPFLLEHNTFKAVEKKEEAATAEEKE